MAQIATADTPGAHAVLTWFRLRAEPSILVTVAMSYEGLDAPEVAALTHIRSHLWALNQHLYHHGSFRVR